MAGFVIYSLDLEKFQQFVTNPTDEQLLRFANIVSEGLDYEQDEDDYDDEDDEDDEDGEEEDAGPSVLTTWPVEPKELVPVLREWMAKDDWYADLLEYEKDTFESFVRSYYSDEDSDLGFRVDSDGVYWDVIELVRSFHHVPPNQVNDVIISQFGSSPYKGKIAPDKERNWNSWHPYHSIHLPDDVKKLREEVLAAEKTVMSSDDENAQREYEDELVPALDKVIRDNRVLYIETDT